MVKLPTIGIWFYLTGTEFCEVDISKKLGIAADEFRAKKDWPDAIKRNKDLLNLPYWYKPRTVWAKKINAEHGYFINEQFEKMINLLEGKEGLINDLRQELDLVVSFEIVIEMELGDKPEMILSSETIKFISSLNATIGIDMYIDEEVSSSFLTL